MFRERELIELIDGEITETNEELALLAKDNDGDALLKLWIQTYEFTFRTMRKYFSNGQRRGVDPEDLMQEGYFALLAAVRAFDPEKGFPFTSYLFNYIRNAAAGALGFRRKQVFVASLDEPLPGTEDYTLADTLEDQQALEEMENAVVRAYREQLRRCLEECVDSLKPLQRRILRARYYGNRTLEQIAQKYGIRYGRALYLEQQALERLAHPRHTGKLARFLYEDETPDSRDLEWLALSRVRYQIIYQDHERAERQHEAKDTA